MNHRANRLRAAGLVRRVLEAERASNKGDRAKALRILESLEREVWNSAYLAAWQLDLAEQHTRDPEALRKWAVALSERETLFPAGDDVLQHVEKLIGAMRVQPLLRNIPGHRWRYCRSL